ncbi:hypothetical protein MTO96_015887 [Rhipicephalus appendiculatus]
MIHKQMNRCICTAIQDNAKCDCFKESLLLVSPRSSHTLGPCYCILLGTSAYCRQSVPSSRVDLIIMYNEHAYRMGHSFWCLSSTGGLFLSFYSCQLYLKTCTTKKFCPL